MLLHSTQGSGDERNFLVPLRSWERSRWCRKRGLCAKNGARPGDYTIAPFPTLTVRQQVEGAYSYVGQSYHGRGSRSEMSFFACQ